MRRSIDSTPKKISRRRFGQLTLGTLFASPLLRPSFGLALNPTNKKLRGLSAFGDLPLPADYRHFAWVNPDAPKGGTFKFSVPDWVFNQNPQTYDTLNSFVLKGASPPRMELCFDSLMIRDLDDPSALYGRLAEYVEISSDRNTYTFGLREGAYWHDGTPLTASDVAFTFDLFKRDGHPDISLDLTHLQDVEAESDTTVVFRFDGSQSDQVILNVCVLPIVSRAFYEQHDFLTTTLVPPLGSGFYRVGKFDSGIYIEYERVEDYWGRDLPFAQGLANFDTLRIDFFTERQTAFEAFKKGEVEFREEFTSRIWATSYDFPAVEEGKVKKRLFESEKDASMQGWALNLRRQKLESPLTREAIGYCFDFEWTNRTFFYDSYTRNESFFEQSEFAASGVASSAERELLSSLPSVDPSVLGDALRPPVSDGSGRDRSLLRRASELLSEAGWVTENSVLVSPSGEPFTLEFLIRSPTFERILAKFVDNLRSVGIEATIRLVDPAQFQRRLDDYDFDIVGLARSYGGTPTAESLRQLFGSGSADRPGGANHAGIRSPDVDALIDRASESKSREELIIALRALDRVLRSTYSWIPNWHASHHRVAYWDLFSWPPKKAEYGFDMELTWWFDESKARVTRGD